MKQLVWGVVALGAVASSVFAAVRGTARATPDESVAGGAQVVRVVRRDIGSVVKATGVIKPRVGAEGRVGSRIFGVVNRLYGPIGDAVTEGQLPARPGHPGPIARRDEAAAALRKLEADLRYLTADRRRKGALNAAGNLSPSDLELADRGFAVAEQQVAGARASLAFAAAQVAYARIVAPIGGVV